ncbi:hypothetical protein [Velocimicrobium porci]|uniref:Uncharacterized protein n=1 Tax=Velocimicrobium porci TaxID=2606634 RepID=A0A6L5Y1B9_9FIRM|nr:hypothetical protein [Velocimicrobium porci]MSS64714.1 hypothetical protein [Velocimicrobium porci]
MKKTYLLTKFFRWMSILIFVIIATLLFLRIVGQTQEQQRQEGRKQLENALHKAVMTCYITEGVYPPTVMYIEKNYGIQIDEDEYTVFYEVFADNIMPEITVLLKE